MTKAKAPTRNGEHFLTEVVKHKCSAYCQRPFHATVAWRLDWYEDRHGSATVREMQDVVDLGGVQINVISVKPATEAGKPPDAEHTCPYLVHWENR